MAVKFLDKTGLGYFWSKIKAWCNATFAAITHNHASNAVNAMTGYSKPNSGSAIATSDSLNSAIGKLEVKVDAIDDSNIVHITGTETITGNKYFKDRKLKIKSTDRVIGETYSSDIDNDYRYNTIAFSDKNGNWGGAIELAFRESGLTDFKIFCTDWNNPGNLSYFASLYLGYDENGIGYVTATSTSENRTNGSDILTRNWIPKDTRIVHTTGNETISGTKRFGAYTLNIETPNAIAGTAPSSDHFAALQFVDKNGSYMAGLQMSNRTTSNYIRLNVISHNDASSANTWYFYASGAFTGPSTPNSPSAGQYLTYDWIPKDTRIVHTTGNENIAGVKTFTSALYLSNSISSLRWNRSDVSFTASGYTVPSSTVYNGSGLYDVTGNSIGYDYFRIQPSGNFSKVWSICNSDGTVSKHFVYTYDKASDSFYLDGPADFNSSENSTKIPNTAWVQSSAVMLSGNQTVAGVKTFTDDIRFKSSSPDIVFTNTGLTKGTNPSTYMWNELLFCDGSEDSSDVHRIGGMHAYVNGDGQTSMQFRVHNWEAGSTDFAILGIYYPKNGIPYTTAPTPATSDNSTKIATTEWVNSKGFVDTTNTQTINGSKTFTSTIEIKRNNPYLYLTETDWEKGTPQGPSSSSYQGIQFREKNSTFAGCIYYNYMSSKASGIHLSVANMTSASATGETDVWLYWNTDNSKAFRPGTNGDILLGWSNYRWKEVWCTQSSINSTSDERVKTSIENIPDQVLDAWELVDWLQYKFIDAEHEKGNKARFHTGAIAQKIDKAFKDKGLDVSRYGLFLYDSWEEVPEEKDKDGNIIQHYMPAGDSYGLRYVEALCMEAAYQRRKNKILENHISELETQVQNMLQILESLKGA